MKTLESLSKDERSLLLLFEARCVDNRSRIKAETLNDLDFNIARAWNEEGFISFGRVASDSLNNQYGNHWCQLSDEAWRLAHAERRARAERMFAKRTWQTTQEKRESMSV